MADDVIRDVPSRFPAGLVDQLELEKVSWGAIWAGSMVAIGLEALFFSFLLFIGGAFGGSVAWTFAWYLVTMAVSYYAGAWTAARLSNVPSKQVSVLHGISMWGLSILGTAIIAGVVFFVLLHFGLVTGFVFPVTTAAIWGALEMYSGIIWGGIILSLGTAYIGGVAGTPTVPVVATEQREPVAPPIRRVG